ncbi:MAG: hypothetical protein ACFCBV_14295 [Phycisphaerales bacterium]|nr:hypothetical protein [Phycisphaerales bacterium]
MKQKTTTAARLARGTACALAMLACVQVAAAEDRITLNDGRVIEGEIARELNGAVWVKTADGLTQFYPASDVLRIERDVDTSGGETPADPGITDPAPSEAGPTETTEAPAVRAPSSNATRVAILSFGDADAGQGMVGTYVTAQSFRECIPLLEEEEIDVVVFRINSGGGAVLELMPLSDVFHNEFKPKFRTVAWIDYAISAASLSPHTLSEHYFMRRGAYGGNTAWFGALQAVEGRGLEDILYMAERISERGGHDPRIIRAMQIMDPLSIDLDENGRVEAMYQNTQGEVLINPQSRVLALTSITAQQMGFADGIADTLEELGKAMGLTEVEFVGEKVEGVAWPVSKAEKYLRRFREQTARDEQRLNEYFDGYNVAIDLARGADEDSKGKFIGFARRSLNSMVRMVDNNPRQALFIFNRSEEQFRDWVREQEELLRSL